MQVLAVTSEIYPLIKTGGLADVAGALPLALKAEGITCRTLLPGYPAVMKALPAKKTAYVLPDLFGGKAQVIMAKVKGLDLFVLDVPHLYNRNGGPYADGRGKAFVDNDLRFAALSKAGALIGSGLIEGYQPDVIHAHDWQAGLTAAYLVYGKPGRRPRTMMTVHNLAFQGQFGRELFDKLGLPAQAFTLEGVEYYGDVGFLKAGLTLSDRLTTVSPTYAAEITAPEGGMGLDGLLRGRADRLSGILNGIDTKVWDPATDTDIAAPFTAETLEARAANKAALRAEFGLDEAGGPLFAVVSRLSWQKGLDLLLDALPVLETLDAQLVVLGSGEPELEAGFLAAAAASPGRIACRIGYDEAGAHRIQAGADALIVPSRFEPCGLTQLCALRYGCVPVVARVGGLNDTIIDASPMALAANASTGVQFAPYGAPMLETGLRRASRLYADRELWAGMQRRGMATEVSWREPAARYAALYRELAR